MDMRQSKMDRQLMRQTHTKKKIYINTQKMFNLGRIIFDFDVTWKNVKMRTDRQTDRQTSRYTDRQPYVLMIFRSNVSSL